MNCPHCGSINVSTQLFCSRCGGGLSSEEDAPRLGPYRLVAKIGEGGMGVVYRAQDDKLHREVAIKVLHPHLLRNRELVDRFRREARLHAQIIHPNIVTLLSVYESARHLALVVEMVHGQTLKNFLRANRRPSVLDVLRISDGILSGLSAAHELNLVHRDLKPANVLLGNDGSIKLMDFGLAKSQGGSEDITKSGATVGSFRYMAPEQILNQPVNERTDLYAFGILLYQMCTGQLPFDITGSGGEFEIMEKQVRHAPRHPKEIVEDMPTALADTIMSLLAKSPDDRPKDCTAVRKLLASVLRNSRDSLRAGAGTALGGTEAARPDAVRQALSGATRKAKSYFSRWLGGKADSTQITEAAATERAVRAPFLGLMAILLGVGIYLLTQLPPSTNPSTRSVDPRQTPLKTEQPGKTAARKDILPAPQAAATEPETRKPAAVATPAKPPKVVDKQAARPQEPVPRSGAVAAIPASLQTSPASRSVTFNIQHKLVRSDLSVVSSEQAHELKGGTHVFFPELEKYLWKDKLRTQKDGWVRLYLNEPAKLSQIAIARASVGGRDFSGGQIQLEVQQARGKWVTVLQIKDRAIEKPLKIEAPREALQDVRGIRMRFRTPEPITIGPIDLLP